MEGLGAGGVRHHYSLFLGGRRGFGGLGVKSGEQDQRQPLSSPRDGGRKEEQQQSQVTVMEVRKRDQQTQGGKE